MDGNNRWSKKNSKEKKFSYQKGANNLLKLSKHLFKNTDVKFVSAFALSSHNLKRSHSIIYLIKDILSDFVQKELNNGKYEYGINFLGNLNFLDDSLLSDINLLKKKTSSFKKKLNIFINYTGQDDLVMCIKNILKNNNKNLKVSKKIISDNLYTCGLPDPDILIRTGGFNRLSDFMLYQLSFTEFFFIKKLWPDFNIYHLNKIINQYLNIDRKFGL